MRNDVCLSFQLIIQLRFEFFKLFDILLQEDPFTGIELLQVRIEYLRGKFIVERWTKSIRPRVKCCKMNLAT